MVEAQNNFAKIQDYIQAHREDMLALWKEIVNTESGPKQIDGINQVGKIFTRELEKIGATVQMVPVQNAGKLLRADWHPELPGKPIVFMGHMDTVFPEGEGKANPFRIDEKNHAHGPGVMDMKGGLVIALYAIKALAAAEWAARPIRFLGIPDEETLHMHSDGKQVIAGQVRGALAAFNGEPSPVGNFIITGRYGGGPVSITVHGVAAHSGSAPEKGRSAVLEAAHKIIQLEAANDIARGKLINCGAIEGGIGENTIPNYCKIRIGIRFRNAAIGKEILELLANVTKRSTVAGTWAELDTSSVVQCMDTTESVKKLFTQYQETAISCGLPVPQSLQVGGLSDAGIAVQEGVPTLCGVGVSGEGAHTREGYAEVASLFERCVLLACTASTLTEEKLL